MTKVKICGITNLEDARHAVECGADILGFILYPESKRYISPADASAIAKEIAKAVVKTGVFVNETVDNVVHAVTVAGLDAVQLQGDETAEFVSELRSKTDAMIVKTFHIKDESEIAQIDGYPADGVLLDTFSPTEWGGTGRTADWKIAERISERVQKFYLAGGLGPDNVAEAIRKVRPFAVDACSRLEASPGRKDHAKVVAFIKVAKEAI